PVQVGYTSKPSIVSRPHGGAFVLSYDFVPESAIPRNARVAALSPLRTLEPPLPPDGLSLGTVGQGSISADGSGGFYVAGVNAGWVKLFRFTAEGSPAIAWPDTGILVGAGPIADRLNLFVGADASVYLSWVQTHRN